MGGYKLAETGPTPHQKRSSLVLRGGAVAETAKNTTSCGRISVRDKARWGGAGPWKDGALVKPPKGAGGAPTQKNTGSDNNPAQGVIARTQQLKINFRKEISFSALFPLLAKTKAGFDRFAGGLSKRRPVGWGLLVQNRFKFRKVIWGRVKWWEMSCKYTIFH